MSAPVTIFVFGSNLSGIHDGGAARHALDHWGAVWGKPVGLQGRSYAIPTKDAQIRYALPLSEIAGHVREFVEFARANPAMSFLVTAIGCGLAGLEPRDIAPMFGGASENVFLSSKLADALRIGDHHD